MRLEHEPIRYIVEEVEGLLDAARLALAAFFNADADGLAFVPNATAGVNTVVRSLRFGPGDELLTNNHEYNACNNALRFAAEQWGASVVSVDVPFPIRSPDQVVESILRGVSPRTRLVLLSHVTSPTGVVFPVERIVAELNRLGIESLIDGAHAPGMLPIDLDVMKPTYYTGNCHKWLCAPKGAAFLWVSHDRRKDIRPLIISHGANAPRTDRSRFRLEFDYTGTVDFSPYLCIPLAINYLASLHERGWPGIYEHNRRTALAGREVLRREFNAPPGAPESMIGSLASVEIPARPSTAPPALPTKYHDPLQDRLLSPHRVQAPIFPFVPGGNAASSTPPVRLVRIACQLYNSPEQIEYLAKVLRLEIDREHSRPGDIQ